MRSVEYKAWDTLVSGTITPTGTTNTSLVNVNQGLTLRDRVGNSVRGSKLVFRGCVCWPNLSSVTLAGCVASDTVRLLIVLDKQSSYTAFTTLDVLDTQSINDFGNRSNSSRFSVLKSFWVDMAMDVNHDGTNYICGGYVRSVSCVLDTPWRFQYRLSSGGLDTAKYNIAMLAISRTRSDIDIQGFSRFFFYDN